MYIASCLSIFMLNRCSCLWCNGWCSCFHMILRLAVDPLPCLSLDQPMLWEHGISISVAIVHGSSLLCMARARSGRGGVQMPCAAFWLSCSRKQFENVWMVGWLNGVKGKIYKCTLLLLVPLSSRLSVSPTSWPKTCSVCRAMDYHSWFI